MLILEPRSESTRKYNNLFLMHNYNKELSEYYNRYLTFINYL